MASVSVYFVCQYERECAWPAYSVLCFHFAYHCFTEKILTHCNTGVTATGDVFYLYLFCRFGGIFPLTMWTSCQKNFSYLKHLWLNVRFGCQSHRVKEQGVLFRLNILHQCSTTAEKQIHYRQSRNTHSSTEMQDTLCFWFKTRRSLPFSRVVEYVASWGRVRTTER